jgi:16S rRNA U516 pseudouridylate synthase RsuA-like enzyme
LNKYLSESGACSRREADTLISEGRVTVNGKPAVLGTQVNEGDDVRLDGDRVGAARKKKPVYIALNKPTGITCTTERHVAGNIIDFVNHPERIFPIGRLDKDSEGLILLTNDGDIVNEVLRAEHDHEKEYVVSVDHASRRSSSTRWREACGSPTRRRSRARCCRSAAGASSRPPRSTRCSRSADDFVRPAACSRLCRAWASESSSSSSR